VGKTTSLLNSLEAGDSILDILGPLGQPSEIKIYGTAVIVAGGMDTATALPTARALRDAGNYVIFIDGARNREMVLFEEELRKASSETYILTDDNSYGEQGSVTNKLNELIADGRKLNFVLAVGSASMMRAIAAITLPRGIKTTVSLKTIMMDGAGMCGGCRVLVGDDSKFACVDGPEFDASLVNFDVLMQRNARYRDKETQSLKEFEEHKDEQLAQCRAEFAEHKRADLGRAEVESTYVR
jgi:ferredoxin--NADP+ reductase